MSDKVIFDNYQDKCPNCGGDLDSNHKLCPFCGQNLEYLNIRHRDNESVIVEAIEDIDDAKRRLKQREMQYVKDKKKSVVSKIPKFILWIVVIWLLIGLIVGIATSIHESIVDKKVEALKEDMRTQNIDVIDVETVYIDEIEFINTDKQSVVGYIQESDKLLKIPFYEDSYSNDGIFKGSVYLDKNGVVEIDGFDDYSTRIEYENFSISIIAENSYYYDAPIDSFTIIENYLDETKRLDDFKVGDVVFECYLIDDDYYFVANPYHDCFITYKVYINQYDDIDVNVEDVFKVLRVDTTFEIG